MRNPPTIWQEQVSIITQAQRRDPRVTLEFPIVVSGFDRFGQFHSERTKTRDVSLMGCSFHLQMEVEKGLVLAVTVVHPKGACKPEPRPVLFRIARAEQRPGGYIVGATKLQADNPWINYLQEPGDNAERAD